MVLILHSVETLYSAIDSSITSLMVHCGTLKKKRYICLIEASIPTINCLPKNSISKRLSPYTIVDCIVAFINSATIYGVAFLRISFIFRLLIFPSSFSFTFSKCVLGSSSRLIHTPRYLYYSTYLIVYP